MPDEFREPLAAALEARAEDAEAYGRFSPPDELAGKLIVDAYFSGYLAGDQGVNLRVEHQIALDRLTPATPLQERGVDMLTGALHDPLAASVWWDLYRAERRGDPKKGTAATMLRRVAAIVRGADAVNVLLQSPARPQSVDKGSSNNANSSNKQKKEDAREINIRDLTTRLDDANWPKGKISKIAREFTGETPGNAKKAESLMTEIYRRRRKSK